LVDLSWRCDVLNLPVGSHTLVIDLGYHVSSLSLPLGTHAMTNPRVQTTNPHELHFAPGLGQAYSSMLSESNVDAKTLAFLMAHVSDVVKNDGLLTHCLPKRPCRLSK